MDITKYYNRLNENNKNLFETIDGISDEKLSKKDKVDELKQYIEEQKATLAEVKANREDTQNKAQEVRDALEEQTSKN